MKDFRNSYNWQEKQNRIKNSYSMPSKTKSPGKTLISGMLFEIDLGKNFKGEKGLEDILNIFYEFSNSCFFDEFDLVSKTIAEKGGQLLRDIWKSSYYFSNEPCCVVLSKRSLGIFISNFYINLKHHKSDEIIFKSDFFRSRRFPIKRARRIYVSPELFDDGHKERSVNLFLTTEFRGNRRYLKDIVERMGEG